MRIIDADGHVAEGSSLAIEAMRRWPEHVRPRADGRALVIEGRNYPEADGPGAGCPREHGLSTAEGIDYSSAQGVLGDADRDQIDTMVLYPSLGLCAPTLEDPDFAAGFARLYNQWIADYCAVSNGRLRGIAVTPIEHGQVAIDVMREAKDLGLVATHIPPALKTRNLDHPDLDRFYAAAEELDMPLGIHGAPGMHLPKVGVDRFTNYIQVHCIANGWQRDPQEYLAAGNIWTTCEPEEPILPGVIDVLGDDFIMFASDYPHWDGEWPESTKHLRTRPDISEESRAKIGGENAKKFYALN
jgi:predicted TIM-barrel fold metal-dependent hydrolase